MIEDTKLQVLHDHYKDSFTHLQNHLKLRDRVFILILIVLLLMSFQITSPKESGEVITQLVTQKLGLTIAIDISFIGSIIWFGLLGLVVRYFQTAVHIERQYKYIHNIEEQISPNFDKKIFTREGKSYLSDYPLFSNWTWILYTIIFPILLLIVVLIKIIGEFSGAENISLSLVFNITTSLCIFISTVLYLLAIHFQK